MYWTFTPKRESPLLSPGYHILISSNSSPWAILHPSIFQKVPSCLFTFPLYPVLSYASKPVTLLFAYSTCTAVPTIPSPAAFTLNALIYCNVKDTCKFKHKILAFKFFAEWYGEFWKDDWVQNSAMNREFYKHILNIYYIF